MPYGDRDVLTPDIFAFVQMRCEQDEQLAGERVEILLAIARTPKLELLDDAALGVGHHAHDIQLYRALAQRVAHWPLPHVDVPPWNPAPSDYPRAGRHGKTNEKPECKARVCKFVE